MLVDSYHRTHDYLRISLTDNCNLRCFYCMPEEDYHFSPPSRLMQPDEIEALAKAFVQQGVRKIRLTGGEPLVRKDATDIIRRLSKLPVSLTMTTNGTRLHEFWEVLDFAGLQSLNISLDTLRSERFASLTRRDQFGLVKGNIDKALEKGFQVKVNMVVMKEVNFDEVLEFVGWSIQAPVNVRFIEFMPFEGNKWTSNKVVTTAEMLEVVKAQYSIEPVRGDPHATATVYRARALGPSSACTSEPSGAFGLVPSGTFGFISTMSAPFCGGCNRMRLTADGKMKNCLFSDTETDLLSALRRGEDVLPLIQQCISAKAEALGGQFTADLGTVHPEDIHNRSMITIGG
jgi:cyclic pyranopterin phosphate synthase